MGKKHANYRGHGLEIYSHLGMTCKSQNGRWNDNFNNVCTPSVISHGQTATTTKTTVTIAASQ